MARAALIAHAWQLIVTSSAYASCMTLAAGLDRTSDLLGDCGHQLVPAASEPAVAAVPCLGRELRHQPAPLLSAREAARIFLVLLQQVYPPEGAVPRSLPPWLSVRVVFGLYVHWMNDLNEARAAAGRFRLRQLSLSTVQRLTQHLLCCHDVGCTENQ
jgi:hypothetical protein